MHDIIEGTYFVEFEGELCGPYGSSEAIEVKSNLACFGVGW